VRRGTCGAIKKTLIDSGQRAELPIRKMLASSFSAVQRRYQVPVSIDRRQYRQLAFGPLLNVIRSWTRRMTHRPTVNAGPSSRTLTRPELIGLL